MIYLEPPDPTPASVHRARLPQPVSSKRDSGKEGPADSSLTRAALHDNARAKNMSRLAREIGVGREGIQDGLSKNGNSTFATVMRIKRTLETKVRITA